MRSLRRLLAAPGSAALVTLAGVAAPAAALHAQAAAASSVVAFTNVNVVPMDADRVLADQTVVVRDGRIAEVGPAASVRVPAGARRVDGRGKYLMPGLAEMHAHIPGANAPPQTIRDIMFLYVANGVTTIRGMLGAPNQLALRDSTASGAVLGPTIFVGAPSLNGNSAPDPAAAARLVRAHKAAGYDLLKLHPGLTRPVYDTIAAVARAEGITWAGHISSDVGLLHTLATRQSTIDHLDGYIDAAASDEVRARAATGQASFNDVIASVTEERLRELAGRTRAAGVWNVPTAYLWETLFAFDSAGAYLEHPELRFVSPQTRAAWANAKRNRVAQDVGAGITAGTAAEHLRLRRVLLKALADSGAGLLMGTDSPQVFNVPGFALHREVRLMHEAGLSPYQVLVSGTRNVARYASEVLGRDGSFGTVAAGNRADLVLLEGNPLADLSSLERRAGVMVRGRWLPRAEIERGLAELAARHAQGS
ncbi:MAG TPA: amidohydrolase family protein [Gemmatimonadaceae bacterium]